MYQICTTIPYVNGQPHLGHLLEAVFNDTIARYKRRVLSEPVLFSMGLDQHGLKVYRKALEQKQDVYKYVGQQAKKFKDVWQMMEISHDEFVETASRKHKVVAQLFWQRLKKRGLIYKKTYTGLYCVGDEAFVSEGQLREGGLCPNHDEKPIKMSEENYFFKLSEFTEEILNYLQNSNIIPEKTSREWLYFVNEGLHDISISREKKNLSWGIEVPDDLEQVMYVWFEALINYYTAVVDIESVDKLLEFPLQKEEFELEIWDQIQKASPINFQYMGKDMPKFHLVWWPAILLGCSLEPTTTNLVHGFINDDQNRKMSKSLGNTVLPEQLIEKYGVDGTRFILIHEINQSEDTPFNWQKATNNYNAALADNLGNLVVRVSNLVEKMVDGVIDFEIEIEEKEPDISTVEVYKYLENFHPHKALQQIFRESSKINQFLEETKPWILSKDFNKNEAKIRRVLGVSVKGLLELAKALSIFLPSTGESIYETFSAPRIVKAKPLFAKVEIE
jgi:methionyl-tRNA synthetase